MLFNLAQSFNWNSTEHKDGWTWIQCNYFLNQNTTFFLFSQMRISHQPQKPDRPDRRRSGSKAEQRPNRRTWERGCQSWERRPEGRSQRRQWGACTDGRERREERREGCGGSERRRREMGPVWGEKRERVGVLSRSLSPTSRPWSCGCRQLRCTLAPWPSPPPLSDCSCRRPPLSHRRGC